MKTHILKVKGDWQEVVDDSRSTVGKLPLGKEPSAEFKRKILIAEHSPIRAISIKWKWTNIPSWVATHWVRHIWYKVVKSQRSDRTGVQRDKLPQDAPVDFTGEANCQHLIDTMRKRLCRQASPETREYADDLKAAIHEMQPELSDVLVCACVYRGFCQEFSPCGYWERLTKDWTKEQVCDWHERYRLYNEDFWSNRKGVFRRKKDDVSGKSAERASGRNG